MSASSVNETVWRASSSARYSIKSGLDGFTLEGLRKNSFGNETVVLAANIRDLVQSRIHLRKEWTVPITLLDSTVLEAFPSIHVEIGHKRAKTSVGFLNSAASQPRVLIPRTAGFIQSNTLQSSASVLTTMQTRFGEVGLDLSVAARRELNSSSSRKNYELGLHALFPIYRDLDTNAPLGWVRIGACAMQPWYRRTDFKNAALHGDIGVVLRGALHTRYVHVVVITSSHCLCFPVCTH